MSHWKRNLIVLCLGQLLTMVGFSAYLPFAAYYMQTLGVRSTSEVTALMAVFESGSAITMMIFAPIWGGLADRFGRKMMLVRATFFGSLLAFLMGLAQNPTQLIAIRLLQGVFCGTVAAANTLVATQTPDESLGKALGVMQTTQYAAHAVGPLIGGVLADAFGFRAVFPMSAAMMAIAMLGVTFLVREDYKPVTSKRQRGRLLLNREALAGIVTRNTLVLMLALSSASFAIAVLSPVFPLFIKSLVPDAKNLGTLAGAITSVSGITSALAALGLGHLGDKFGRKRVLIICVIGAALVYGPQAWATNPMQLLVLRAVQGVFMGGVMPTANALLAQSAAASRRGTVFGLASGFQSGGRALGPVAGAAVAQVSGLTGPFWVTAGIFAALAVLVGLFVQIRPAQEAIVEKGPVPVGAKVGAVPPRSS